MRLVLQFIVCFLLFSLHLTLPYLRSHGEFSPFSFTPSGHIFDETHFYSPAAHRFARFGILSYDTDVFENRNSSGLYSQGPTVLIGGLAKLTGNFELTWLFLHGLFPALLWLIAYLILKDCISAWLFLLLGFGPKLALLLSSSAFLEPPDITRIPNPALSSLFLFGAMGLLIRCLKEGFPRWTLMALALVSGLLFEFYPFYAMAWYVGIAFIVFFKWLEKDFKSVRALILTVSISLLLSAHALWPMFSPQTDFKKNILLRQGFASHTHSLPGLCLFAASLVGVYITLKHKKYLRCVLFAILGGSGLCSNLQVITGIDLHYWLHFRMRIIQPVLIVLGVDFIYPRVRAYAPLLVSLLFALTLYREIRLGSTLLSLYNEKVPQFEMLRWMRKNISEPSVFSTTDLDVIAVLPAVSGHWSFVPSCYRTQVSDEEILKRSIIASKREGKSKKDVFATLSSPAIIADAPWTVPIYFLLRRPSFSPDLASLTEGLWNQTPEGHSLQTNYKLDYQIVRKPYKPAGEKEVTLYENTDWKILATK